MRLDMMGERGHDGFSVEEAFAVPLGWDCTETEPGGYMFCDELGRESGGCWTVVCGGGG